MAHGIIISAKRSVREFDGKSAFALAGNTISIGGQKLWRCIAMAIEIKILQRGDESALMNVAAEVFDNPIDAERTREFLEDRRHHIAVAIEDGLVVGFASGVHYVHPDKGPELWINEVGLAATHRRRGLGKAVLKALLEVGRAHHCRVAWVLTYQGNVAAKALYSSLGGSAGADDSGPSNAMIGYSFALAE
jgi:GNAT superfamily N-acetyltransferase